jgi:glutamate synthase domain-containing protein 2
MLSSIALACHLRPPLIATMHETLSAQAEYDSKAVAQFHPSVASDNDNLTNQLGGKDVATFEDI